ncbi:MAG: hypothetical protein P8P17_20190 [Pseudomonadales bacterium]|nr:hypothetical protein [Pseudomonadales bacterium]
MLTIFKNGLILMLMCSLVACGGGGGGSPAPAPAPVPVADSDSDGVNDDQDAFPNDANETVDTDEDGVGDNGDNCLSDANADQLDSDANGAGDACDPIPETYSFTSSFIDGESSVSYTGQTARQLLILGLVDEMVSLNERPGEEAAVVAELSFYMDGDGADEAPHGFDVSGGEPVIPGPNYGDISSGKNLDGKIAGGNGEGGGETQRLINDEFFGWEEGLDADPLPIELVNYFIARMAVEATDGATPTISTVGNPAVEIDSVTIDAAGVDYRQLTQKFLTGAVSLSQGTNDYFQTDYPNALGQEDEKAFSAGEHDFDEAFGYYGGARNMNDYTDDEAAGKGGRDEFGNGYNDANADGNIDVRSEIVLGHAQNCAKRDRGSAGATDFSKEVFDAFLVGRKIVSNATVAGSFSEAELAALNAQIRKASTNWEACVAATVVHYINDVTADMGNYVAPDFADLDNFKDMAKHWGEMKGFALALQFSPFSPFRDGSVDDIAVEDLRLMLRLLGDAPVFADGSQGGVPAPGTAQAAIDAYLLDLKSARDILEKAYGFDPDVVAAW